MEDDASLVVRTVKGDSAAFGILYDRYAGLIRAACFDSTRDLTIAQDLAQEVFVRAYAKLGKLRKEDSFAAWLFGIARHVCLEWQRTRRRDRHRYTSDPPETHQPATPDLTDTISELRLAIADLPERERSALHLFYLQSDPVDDARRVLGLSKSAFYKVVASARERLAKVLSKRLENIR